MNDTDLAYIDATSALAAFRNRSLSPVELLDAIIKRTEAVEPVINAFTDTYFDLARDAARAAEKRYGNKTARPLEGIPCVIKDEIRVAGQRNTSGSLIFRNRVDTETDVMAQRLIDAGIIIHARTTTPEFCLLGVTHSRLHGVTRNPHNPGFTPGGSSGGTGASLAAGTTTIGTGTDIAGSIRIPAGACGIVGLKAAYGRIPEAQPFNLDFYSHCGPMTRTVADSALMLNLTSGASPRDITSLRDTLHVPTRPESIKGWKIAYSMNLGFFEVSDEVVANTQRVLDQLTALGCELTEVDFPWDQSCDDATGDYLNVLWGQHMNRLLPHHRDEMTDYAIRSAELAASATPEHYLSSLEKAVELYNYFGPLMEQHDLFVCPTNGLPAVAADQDPWDDEFTINGRKVDADYGWIMTHPFNMLSRCPVLSIPSGKASNGVPTGVQLVGKTYDELSVYRVAMALEPAFGFQRPVT